MEQLELKSTITFCYLYNRRTLTVHFAVSMWRVSDSLNPLHVHLKWWNVTHQQIVIFFPFVWFQPAQSRFIFSVLSIITQRAKRFCCWLQSWENMVTVNTGATGPLLYFTQCEFYQSAGDERAAHLLSVSLIVWCSVCSYSETTKTPVVHCRKYMKWESCCSASCL